MIYISAPKQFLTTFLLSIACLFLSVSVPAQNGIPEDFDNWVNTGMAEWKIPGMAIGVVKDGEVIFSKGFGEKSLGSNKAVNEHTVFGIASVSKNMTAAALAILVDEGKLNWDDKVTDHIPWFELSDPWVTSQVTVRDLLIHRVGVGRMLGNRLQFMTESSRDDVIRQMRYMDFEAPFRYKSVYSNVMYSVAGQLIEYIEGVSWDEFLINRLFKPLGMNNTTTSITQLDANTNKATPHQEIEGKTTPIQWRNWDNAGPAGGVNSTVVDLNKWMIMQLSQPGVYNNKRLISENQMREMHRPQIAYQPADPYAAQSSYGLGWQITDYKGERIISHGGATDGFNTFAFLVPNQNLGIVVVTNTFNYFGNAVFYKLLDSFLGTEERNWQEHYFSMYQNAYNRVSQIRESIHNSREKNTQPKHVLDKYTGTYTDLAYGKVEVFKENNQLKVKFWDTDDLTATLEHWHHDRFRAVWNNPAQREEFSWFTMDVNGNVENFHFEFCLRPMLLQVGAYPSNYTRVVEFRRE